MPRVDKQAINKAEIEMIYVFLTLGIFGSIALTFIGVRLFTEFESTFWGLVGFIIFIIGLLLAVVALAWFLCLAC